MGLSEVRNTHGHWMNGIDMVALALRKKLLSISIHGDLVYFMSVMSSTGQVIVPVRARFLVVAVFLDR
jgi:hypothetical protein